jgi:uridylate kinase
MQSVLIKLSGEIFSDNNGQLSSEAALKLIAQIKTITRNHHVSIVIGGGNFFRGSIQGKRLGLRPTAAHYIGMHATVLNGLALQELMAQEGIEATLLAPNRIYGAAAALEPAVITQAKRNNTPIIFVGGTGIPFVTTDTAAIMRALQVEAGMVIKATNVAGVFDKDPKKHPDAQLLQRVSYGQALAEKLGIMDSTALSLAQEHGIVIKVLSMHANDCLVKALQDDTYGSTIY